MTLSGTVRSAALRFGYDIRRVGKHFYRRPIDFIRSRNIDLVIDVGANIGQYGDELRENGYTGWIVSFEPISAAYQELSGRTKNDGRWTVLNMALGSDEGTASLNISESSVFSSFLPQLPAAVDFDPEAQVIRSESVMVARLDDILKDLPNSNAAFLKIDTQGFEQKVLLGATNCLSNFLRVQMELPIMHLYEGTWAFHEAVAYMIGRGFEISNLSPANYDHTDRASLVEVDCIFRRR